MVKKHKKKCLAILLALLTLLNLCSCGNEQSSDLERTEGPNITLRWLIVGERSKSMDGVVSRFNEELKELLPGTVVEFEVVSKESYKEKWDMIMSANEPIDIVWVGNDVFNYTEEVRKGSFMALDYLLETFGQDLTNEIPAQMWNMQKRDGKIYSVPLKGALYRKDYAIVTSKSNMEKYGDANKIMSVNQGKQHSDVECYATFGEYLARLDEEHRLGTGVSCDTFINIADKGYEGIYGQDSPFVIDVFEEKLKVYNKYELPAYEDYFKTMHEWYKKGYIREDIEEVLAPENDNGILSGNSLFLDEYGEMGVVADEIVTDYEEIRIPLQDYKYISYEAGRNALAIPRTTEYPQVAMEVINLLSSTQGEELCKLLANGMPGRHFVQRGDGQIDRVTDEKGKVIYQLSPYIIGDRFLNYENYKGEFEQLEKYNNEAKCSPLIGFELDTRMIVLEMMQVDLIAEEYLAQLKYGTTENWEEAYQEMLSRMKKAGASKVLVEIQKQLDAFEQ